jgi:hypothetical protein
LHRTYRSDAIMSCKEGNLERLGRLTGFQADAQGKGVEPVLSLCILDPPTKLLSHSFAVLLPSCYHFTVLLSYHLAV